MQKHLLLLFISIFILLSTASLVSQPLRKATNKDQTILLQAKAIATPTPKVIISWKKHELALQYRIQRKGINDWSWSPDIANLDSTKSSFEDVSVVSGEIYEYKVFANCKGLYNERVGGQDTLILEPFIAYGYVCSGVNANLPPKGKILLLIDQTVEPALTAEINQLKDDLVLEGWTVASRLTPRAESFDGAAVLQVKQIIDEEATENMSIFIIGRVPVPYSGNFNPDAHPDHQGAWPADLYYGDNGKNFWSDYTINNTVASRQENKNIPGDGKFDLVSLAVNIEFPVGRIDFYNMPAFSKTEVELLKQYLDKDHKYRIGINKPVSKCIVDDNFGSYIEGFSTSGWRLSPLVGYDNITDADYFTSLGTETYYWSYGTGGGSYNSAGGIGSTSDFASKNVNGIFSMLFGSYFGDWDSQNNFLRAPLASAPSMLTCSWSGRPQWYYHQMGMGLPIGFSTIMTQNNQTTYIPNYLYPINYPSGVIYSIGMKQVHQALMGDPTLSMYMNDAPVPKTLSLSQPDGKPVSVFWDQVFDDNMGYNLYKSVKGYYGPYTKVNSTIINDTKYIDSTLFEGEVFYMLRTVKQTISQSGSFLNESRGIIKSLVVTGINDDNQEESLTIKCTPNPATDFIRIELFNPADAPVNITVNDLTGNIVHHFRNDYYTRGNYDFSWDLIDANGNKVSPGVYFIHFSIGNNTYVEKVSVFY